MQLRFGTIDPELEAIVSQLITLPVEEFSPLILQRSREELLDRFGNQEIYRRDLDVEIVKLPARSRVGNASPTNGGRGTKCCERANGVCPYKTILKLVVATVTVYRPRIVIAFGTE